MAVFKSSRIMSCVTKITIIQERNGETSKNIMAVVVEAQIQNETSSDVLVLLQSKSH